MAETREGELKEAAAEDQKTTQADTADITLQQDTEDQNGESEQVENAESMNSEQQKSPEADWKTQFLYLKAEMDNMRKRFVREKSDVIQHASDSLLSHILPVLDNLDFAVKAVKDSEEKLEEAVKENKTYSNLVKGVEMTLEHFKQTITQIGAQVIGVVGEDFDPSLHEAVGEEESAEVDAGKVCSVILRGYQVNGRVLRPAKVLVAKQSTKKQPQATESEE